MDILIVRIACLLAGLGFAVIAAWLMSRKGNTIRDTYEAFKGLESQQIEAITSKLEAVKIDILGQIKLSSNVPTVALFVVAAVVAITPLVIPLNGPEKKPVVATLQGSIENYQALVSPESGGKIYAYPVSMAVQDSGWFTIPVRSGTEGDTVQLESPHTSPVTLTLRFNPESGTVTVDSNLDSASKVLPVKDQVASLGRILIGKAAVTNPALLGEGITPTPTPDPQFRDLPLPDAGPTGGN